MVGFQHMNPTEKVKYGNSDPLILSEKTIWLEISKQNCLKFSNAFETIPSTVFSALQSGKT